MYKMIFVIFLAAVLSCSNGQKTSDTTPGEVSLKTDSNFLSMKINGQLWEADHDIVGAFHPKGYDQLIIIGGSSGKKDKVKNLLQLIFTRPTDRENTTL